jgi:Tfp pilus assembly protein PilO
MNFSLVNILLIGIAIAFFGFMAYWFYMSMTMEDVSEKEKKAGNPSGENQPKNKADKSNKK